MLRHQPAPSQSTGPLAGPTAGPTAGPAAAGPEAGRGQAGGNGDRAQILAKKGPTGDARVDGALAAAFGDGVWGLGAVFGDAGSTAALGAEAMAEGDQMTFGAGIRPDATDPASLEVIAHEVAHALAPQGKGEGVDLQGDPGEAAAATAGAGFRRWAEAGFAGPAPSLRPAAGGQAQIQRSPTAPTTLTGSPTLQRGSTGGQVATLQTLLARAGFGVGVDGDFGPNTHRAVRRFQASKRLPADGVVGPQTAAALNRYAVAAPVQGNGQGNGAGQGQGSGQGQGTADAAALQRALPLQQGTAGAAVRALQLLLNRKGARIVVDQEFGPMTANAVRGFQAANGLGVDGVVGPRTLAALQSATSKPIGARPPAGGGQGQGPGQGLGPEPEGVSEWRDRVLAAAQKHLGKLYWWGADGPSNFDCSGFALYVLRQETGLVGWGDDTAAGIKGRLPRTENPRKGDMVFYTGGGSTSHIEICAGSGSTTIGASGGGSRTRGNDPDAKVQWGNWNRDGRSKSFGSIQGLIEAKIASQKKKKSA